MRILITTSVWGDKYRDLFANFSLASMLAPGNLPALAKRHHVTVQFITQRSDIRWLWSHRNVKNMEEWADLDMILMEDRDIVEPPDERSGAKYGFVTQLQNIAIRSAHRYDAVIFNYADFIWADGSLPNAVNLLGDADAVLGFCLPVDTERGKAALAGSINGGTLNIAPRELAALAIENLHVEATYRFVDAPAFTRMPSYILTKVGDGLEVRAYHQTALVARSRALAGGIRNGTLDGAFTGEIARHGPVVHADDSDKVMVVSLHDGASVPKMRGGSREESIAAFEARCTPQQIAFANVPLRVTR